MSEDYARQKAYELVAAAIPGVAIMYENQPFEQPTGAPFVKIAVQPNVSQRKDIGSNRRIFRHFGVINCSILVPENTGMATENTLASDIFHALADQKFAIPGGGYLTFCYAKRSNRGTLNGWHSQGVMVEYHIDKVG